MWHCDDYLPIIEDNHQDEGVMNNFAGHPCKENYWEINYKGIQIFGDCKDRKGNPTGEFKVVSFNCSKILTFESLEKAKGYITIQKKK